MGTDKIGNGVGTSNVWQDTHAQSIADLLIKPEVSYTIWNAADRHQSAGVLCFERKF